MEDKTMKFGLPNSTGKSFSKALSLFFNRLLSKFALFEKAPFILYTALLVGGSEISAAIDLEENIQGFVLETKQIKIPESPHAFNPSIIRWRGNLLMSYREISTPLSDPNSAANSYIYIVRLDENFDPIGKAQKLSLGLEGEFSRSEDARLILVAGELYMIYSDNTEKIAREGGFRIHVAKLDDDGEMFQVVATECLSQFQGESSEKREKNWVPFDYEGTLLFAYSLTPLRILRPLLDGSGVCEAYVATRPSIVWEWGELRGGTQALLINDEEYLAFFHSSIHLSTVHSKSEPILHYFMGACLFSSDPPFEMKKISPEPIIGKNFYSGIDYEPYWKPVRVVFPCGFVNSSDFIWVSYGRQDHEIWIAKLDKKELLASLIQVSTLSQ